MHFVQAQRCTWEKEEWDPVLQSYSRSEFLLKQHFPLYIFTRHRHGSCMKCVTMYEMVNPVVFSAKKQEEDPENIGIGVEKQGFFVPWASSTSCNNRAGFMVLGETKPLFLIQMGMETMSVPFMEKPKGSISLWWLFSEEIVFIFNKQNAFLYLQHEYPIERDAFWLQAAVVIWSGMYSKYFNKCFSSSSFSPKTLTKLMYDWEIYSYVKKFPRQLAVPCHKYVHQMSPVRV